MAKVEVVMDEKALSEINILNYRLIKFSWALFFILIGGSWILENVQKISNSQKWGFIYAGCGTILLLLNGLRLIWHIKISRFTVGLGIFGLLLGISTFYGYNFSIWAAGILIIGLILLFDVIKK